MAWGLLGVQLEMRSAGLTAQGVMVARSSHKACRCTIVGTENWILEKILWHIQESGSMLMEILEEQHFKPWKPSSLRAFYPLTSRNSHVACKHGLYFYPLVCNWHVLRERSQEMRHLEYTAGKSVRFEINCRNQVSEGVSLRQNYKNGKLQRAINDCCATIRPWPSLEMLVACL